MDSQNQTGQKPQKIIRRSGARASALGVLISIIFFLLIVGVSFSAETLVRPFIRGKTGIMLFVSDDASQQDIEALQRQLKSDPRVKSVSFTTKEEALARLEKTLGRSLEVTGDNPLPASFTIKLNNAQDVEQVVSEIKQSNVFLRLADHPDDPSKSLKYDQEVLTGLYASVLRVVCVIVLGILAFVTLIFIIVTIVLEASERKKLQKI